MPSGLHQWLAEQTAQAVRPVIGCPVAYDALLERERLRAAIDRLSPAHRQVLVETYYRDAPAASVGRLIGIRVGTARSRLHYALVAPRDHLGGPSAAQA